MDILDRILERFITPSTKQKLVCALESEAESIRYEDSAFATLISAMKSGGKYGPRALQNVILNGDAIIDDLTNSLDNAIIEQNVGFIAYIILALCDIGSPRSANTMISCFNKNFGTARIIRGNVFFSFDFSDIYHHITIYLHNLQSDDKLPEYVLPKLRAFLENALSHPAYFNALPYVIDAVSLLGEKVDIPLIEKYLAYSCPEFDISEKEIRDSAKRAKDLLQERENSAWNNKGFDLYKLGKYDEAIKAFDEIIRLKPNFSLAWLYKGNALCKVGNYKEALNAYNRAISINPRLVKAWSNKGLALKSLGQTEDAEAALAKANKLASDG